MNAAGPSQGVHSRGLLGRSRLAGLCVSAVLYTLAREPWQVYVAIAVGALQGFVQSPISAFNSRAVDARSQGELQGAVQSIGSIAAIIGPPMYTQTLEKFSGPNAIYHLPGMPILLAAAISLVTLALFLKGAALLEGNGQLSSSTSQ